YSLSDQERAYLIFGLRAGAQVFLQPLGDAHEIDELVSHWRREVSRAPGDPAALRRAGDALRAKVWEPVTAYLGSVRKVLVVADGALNLVPLAGLPAKGGGYLIEEGWAFQNLTTERDMTL